MVLVNRKTWKQHFFWVVLSLVLFALSVAAYIFECQRIGKWPTGSSPVCLALGILGGGLIIFEFLLWGRKKLRTWRVGSAKTWMIAHIWLGLLIVPLAFLHSGFYWGGLLSTTLMIVFLIVIFSGVLGLVLQNIIPSTMLRNVEAETIYSQIDRVVCYMRRDAQALLRSIDSDFKFPELANDPVREDEEEMEKQRETVVISGAVRETGKVRGRVLNVQLARLHHTDAGQLFDFVEEFVEPYLQPKTPRESPLKNAQKAGGLFRTLKATSVPQLHPAVDLLESLCDQRRELALQSKYQLIMHCWLYVHLPLSIILLVLLLLHIWFAVRYW